MTARLSALFIAALTAFNAALASLPKRPKSDAGTGTGGLSATVGALDLESIGNASSVSVARPSRSAYFACALRVSELVSLNVEDIAISDDRIALTIRDAKTAKNNEVQHVIAACSEDDDLCPVNAVRYWLDFADIEAGPALRGITRHETVRSGAISTRAVGDIIKDRSKEAGVIGWAEVSSHSLRRGWATEAAAQNVPQAIIKQHGRWKTDASAARYVDAAGSESALAATRAVIGGIRFAEAMAAQEPGRAGNDRPRRISGRS